MSAIEGFQVLAEGLPCTVWIADSAGKVDWYNRDFQKYTGLSMPESLARGWILSVHPDDQQAVAKKWAHALASGEALNALVRLRSAAGVHRWFSVRARRFAGENGESGKWLGTFADIHDRQMTLEANSHVVDALMDGYLSKQLPKIDGVAIDSLYLPANLTEKLGGDWYDVFQLPDGRVGFSLGDVCGHGVEAAVKMGEAKQAIFVAACLGDPAPKSVLDQANAVLFLNNHHVSITTAVYGIVDASRRTVTYASAGHHPPILARLDGTAEILPNHGFPLGVEEHMPPLIRTHEFSYEAGSIMVLYTDGLIEFSHDIFDGEARLLAAAGEAAHGRVSHPATFIARRVLGAKSPLDDVAVLTLSF